MSYLIIHSFSFPPWCCRSYYYYLISIGEKWKMNVHGKWKMQYLIIIDNHSNNSKWFVALFLSDDNDISNRSKDGNLIEKKIKGEGHISNRLLNGRLTCRRRRIRCKYLYWYEDSLQGENTTEEKKTIFITWKFSWSIEKSLFCCDNNEGCDHERYICTRWIRRPIQEKRVDQQENNHWVF